MQKMFDRGVVSSVTVYRSVTTIVAQSLYQVTPRTGLLLLVVFAQDESKIRQSRIVVLAVSVVDDPDRLLRHRLPAKHGERERAGVPAEKRLMRCCHRHPGGS